jgi:hypothetical protein
MIFNAIMISIRMVGSCPAAGYVTERQTKIMTASPNGVKRNELTACRALASLDDDEVF